MAGTELKLRSRPSPKELLLSRCEIPAYATQCLSPFMATTGTLGAPARKVIARLAMIGLDDKVGEILRDCFRQFGISSTPVTDDPTHRFLKEKFEACVLKLDDTAEPILLHIRN